MDKNKLRKTTLREKKLSMTKEQIIKEASRIEESTTFSAKKHFISSSFWQTLHLVLGLPTVVLSALVSLAIFSQFDPKNVYTGYITLVITALSSLTTFFNPNEKINSHKNSGNNYDSLCNKVRIFRTIDCWKEKSDEVLTEKIKYFSEQKDRLNQDSLQTSWISYFLAKKGIEKGEVNFAVDKEDL